MCIRDRLRPIDPYKDGRAYVYIEAVGYLAEKLKGEVPVRAPGCGSLAMAAHLMGINEFVMELAVTEAEEDTEKEKYIMEMMEVCTETLCRFAAVSYTHLDVYKRQVIPSFFSSTLTDWLTAD